ncbi:MAG: aminotransferase class I/II-fold pyridoxal phosphate-dependent enzyme, partial [Candidatus Altiarchaeota archaeon]|nr:aminotransferase class I/II-fold pyridoxal phosphate-dependent enzyme [Candidatus Altiarchaeota archaeon]
MKIPFNRIYTTGNEIKYIRHVIEDLAKTSGDGFYTRKVNSFLEDKFKTEKALMTTSCTHSIEMACRLIGLKPGDEVILPSYTFPSTANPAVLCGAKPVFAEIKRETLNIDPEDVRKRITKK